MDPIYVTGHRNPDTDSIVAAMAYTALRNALGDREYEAACLGRVSDETQTVLNRFGFKPPKLITSMHTQIKDLDYDTPAILSRAVTVGRAWDILQQQQFIRSVPVAKEDGTLYGILSRDDVANYNMTQVLSGILEEEGFGDLWDYPMSEIEHIIEQRHRVVLVDCMVWNEDNGRYELISGHRRKRACELAGLESLRCDIVDLTRDEAIVLMVESNYQRSNILPSEKAFAYKMRLDAMNRQGKRNDLTSDPVGTKLRSNQEFAIESGDSTSQIHRYIRLTNLVPELLEYVDNGQIKMRPAVELSYLDEESQRDVVDRIDRSEIFPSHAQTRRMRKLFEEGSLDYDKVSEIMEEIKPNQVTKRKFSYENLRQYIPDSYPDKKAEEIVIKALDHYFRYLQRQKEQSR